MKTGYFADNYENEKNMMGRALYCFLENSRQVKKKGILILLNFLKTGIVQRSLTI